MLRFVIYLGKNRRITCSGNGLTKNYNLEKGRPFPVVNESDWKKLLLWNESSGCGTCGRKADSYPVMTDTSYCNYQKIDLVKFREEWAEHYKLNMSDYA